MENLLESLFGAGGRINRARYWRSVLIFGVTGLMVGVVLLTVAGIAAPLFIVVVVIVFLPWLMWGFSIHTERLHDRNKSAWWLLTFYALPAGLDRLANAGWFAGTAPQFALAMAAFALSIWGFVEIGCLRGTAGPNRYGSNPLAG